LNRKEKMTVSECNHNQVRPDPREARAFHELATVFPMLSGNEAKALAEDRPLLSSSWQPRSASPGWA
jgi:hypothetical protein